MENKSFLRKISPSGGRPGRKFFYRALLMLTAAVLLFSGCPYYKPAFRGKVIDAETGESVEGAVVTAVYSSEMSCFCCIPLWPVGGNCQEKDVRETLTDRKGIFHIPLYAGLMFPYSTGCSTTFIIFKPGYGKYAPSGFSRSAMETFFSKKTGDTGEIENYDMNKGMVKMPVIFGVVKLSKAKTWEERREALPSIPYIKSPLLREMDREETEWLYKNKGWRR